MRSGGAVCGLVLTVGVLGSVGCVGLDDHTRLKAANRNLTAEKESIGQELFDERHVNDTLRTKVDACERELLTKNELLANLRGENELLDELRRDAKGTLEGFANKSFGDIIIPALPGPLDNAVKRFAEEHPSEVEYDPTRGLVKWKGDLMFPLGSDEVRAASSDSLRSFAEVLKSAAAANFEVIIVGHTDNRPVQRPETKSKHPTNWHLSTHRAIAVGNVLQKHGCRPDRIGCMGCGEYRPSASNAAEAGQSQNRRVELYIVPVGSIIPTASANAAPMPRGDTDVLASPKATKP
mgnify:CR=1 FL=1